MQITEGCGTKKDREPERDLGKDCAGELEQKQSKMKMCRGDTWQAAANRLSFNFCMYFIFVSKALKLRFVRERSRLSELGFKQEDKMHFCFV